MSSSLIKQVISCLHLGNTHSRDNCLKVAWIKTLSCPCYFPPLSAFHWFYQTGNRLVWHHHFLARCYINEPRKHMLGIFRRLRSVTLLWKCWATEKPGGIICRFSSLVHWIVSGSNAGQILWFILDGYKSNTLGWDKTIKCIRVQLKKPWTKKGYNVFYGLVSIDYMKKLFIWAAVSIYEANCALKPHSRIHSIYAALQVLGWFI